MSRGTATPGGPLLLRLLRGLVGEQEAARRLGDLAEEGDARRRQTGRGAHQLWLTRELVLLCAWAALDRLGPGRHPGSAHLPARSIEMIGHDVRSAVRALAKRWPTTLTALAVIALGVGLNVGMFEVVKATVLTPFPFPDAHELQVLLGTWEAQGWTRASLSIPELGDLVERSPLLDEVGIHRSGVRMSLPGDDGAQKVEATFATSAYFRALQVGPAIGRTFLREEDTDPGAHPVVIVSHEFWLRHLEGSPAAVGSEIELSQRRYQVVGVMPPGFLDIANGYTPTDVWIPLSMGRPFLGATMFETRSNRQYVALARVPGTHGAARLQAELDRVAGELETEFPRTHEGRGMRLWSLGDMFFGSMSTPLRVLLAGAALVLVICCVNVAAILLVQTRARAPELALRGALGASRARLVRQLLTESMILALGGGLIGILLAGWGTRLIVGSFSLGLPLFANVTLDAGVLVVAVVMLVLVGLVFRIYPALRFSGGRGGLAIESNRVAGSSRRFSSTVLVGEIAIATMLLVGAGLTTKSLLRLLDTPTGYATERLLTFAVDLSRGDDTPTDPDAAERQVRAQAEDRVAFVRGFAARTVTLPGVETVGFIGPNVLGDANWHIGVAAAGVDITVPANVHTGQRLVITPGTLAALGIELLRGRDFDHSDDTSNKPVAIVDQRLAAALWPGRDPLGMVLQSAGGNRTVIGVAAGAKHRGRLVPDQTVAGDVYIAYAQQPWLWVSAAIRTTAEADPGVLAAARAVAAEIAPGAVIDDVMTMDSRIRRAESVPRFVASLSAVYAAVAAVLAFVGVYGVLAYAVRARAREFAVRNALGASRPQLLGHVVRQGLQPAAVGTVVGLAAAVVGSRTLESLLFGVESLDPGIFVAVAALVGVASAAACLLPALRAARIPPAAALRSE